jgi:nucleotide-binding universal stress UspA family protein
MKGKMKILIAYDGSDCASAALADLSRAGLPQEVEAVVLSVADVWVWSTVGNEVVMPVYARAYAGPWDREREEALQAVEEARAMAEQAKRRIQDDFPVWSVTAEACADSPPWGVIKKADEWKPDLVVVGSHGRSALGRFLLGSVSQKVVTHAPCSVRVARGQMARGDSPVRILIGVDGSRYSEAAVEAVARRAWPAGSEARVVVALDLTMMSSLSLLEEVSQEDEVSATKIAEAAAEKLRGAGLIASTLVKKADPRRLLIDEAERWEADSVFVGARGLRAIGRFLIGSVSSAVAARAHCSVEVIRIKGDE